MRTVLFLAALALATPALASESELTMDSVLGTTLEEVSASLTALGYEVRKSEMEDGKLEVYFVKDKTMGEIYVDAATGKVIKLEMK